MLPGQTGTQWANSSFPISVMITDRKRMVHSAQSFNPKNLFKVPCYAQPSQCPPTISTKAALLNIRSLSNKSFLVNDLITTNNRDFMLLCETWLHSSNSAPVLIKSAAPNFKFMSVSRSDRRGGGVAVFCAQNVAILTPLNILVLC